MWDAATLTAASPQQNPKAAVAPPQRKMAASVCQASNGPAGQGTGTRCLAARLLAWMPPAAGMRAAARAHAVPTPTAVPTPVALLPQVEGCGADLSELRYFFRKQRICGAWGRDTAVMRQRPHGWRDPISGKCLKRLPALPHAHPPPLPPGPHLLPPCRAARAG